MKIKFGSLVVAGSGKIGGHVASKNRGGAYLRTKVTPSNPQTVRQLTARSILSSLSSAWSGLTSSQRAAWNSAVAQFANTDIFGDIRNPSGINLFVKLNTNLTNIGSATLLTPPVKTEVGFEPIASAGIAVGVSEFEVILQGNSLDTEKVLLFATPQLSQGTNFVKNRLRLVGSYTVATDTIGSPGDVFNDYVAKFGVPTAGANIKMQFYPIIATGQAGLPVSSDVIVTA